ncbi:MAG: chromate efflux transporter [Actinomadura sp.]
MRMLPSRRNAQPAADPAARTDPASEPVAEDSRDEQDAPPQPPGFAAFLRYFLGLGTWGFGGPIASVGYMQRDLVERRGWLSKQEFLDGVALGQAMPGPLAAQVVMWVGFLRRGRLGALATAIAFVTPSFLLVFAVAVVYVRFSGLSVVQALFYGIAPAVMAIIAVAAYKLGRLTNRRDARLWVISIVVGLATAITGTELASLFIAAGLIMIILDAPPKLLTRLVKRGATGIGLLPGLPKAAVPTLAITAGSGTLVALGLFFLKAGAFIFGSGLAIVPFLHEGVVADHHWLTDRQFLDAVAMGLITPGPVVIFSTFIGYLVAGTPGAIVATIAIFIPIYAGVVIPGPWFIRHRDNPQIQAFIKGATAAAAGAIAGAVYVLTRQTVTDIPTAAIALAGLALVLRFKNKEPFIVAAGALAGLLLY